MRILAIDQGTTSTRGLVYGENGIGALVFQKPHRQFYPQPHAVEHDPDELVAHVEAAIAAAGAVDAIGLANQGESCLAWDGVTKEALSPVWVWQDDRTANEVERLRRDGLEPRVRAISGLPLDSYFSATKLAAIVRNCDGAKTRLADGRLRLGTTDAFFLDRLTGRATTDPSTASRTSLMDLRTGEWSAELCEAFGVPMAALPEIVPTSGARGSVGIKGRSVSVMVSICDQQGALYGHGCRRPGDAKITFGTGAFVLAVADAGVLENLADGILPTLAWARAGESHVYAVEASVHSASAAVNWWKTVGRFDDWNGLDTDRGPSAIEQGVCFVPALSGLATPHWDRDSRGAFFGLALQSDEATMGKAVLEGIAFRSAETIDALDGFIAKDVPISIDGGLTANRYFCQALADISRRRLRIAPSPELTAEGVARLAARELGRDFAEPASGRLITPKRDLSPFRARFADALTGVRHYGRNRQER